VVQLQGMSLACILPTLLFDETEVTPTIVTAESITKAM